MNRIIVRLGGLTIALLVAAALVGAPIPGRAQTPGMEHRQTRRGNRDDARATRQEGRHAGRDAKQDCKDAGGNRMDCRQQKRAVKQGARGASRDQRWGTGPNE